MEIPHNQPRVGGISAQGRSKWRINRTFRAEALKLLPIEPQGESLCDQTLHVTGLHAVNDDKAYRS